MHHSFLWHGATCIGWPFTDARPHVPHVACFAELTQPEVVQRVKDKWKAMDAEERKVYEQLNLDDKERFKRETEVVKQQEREARRAAGLPSDESDTEVRCVERSL